MKADAGSGDIELDLQGISERDAYGIACGSGDVMVNKKYYDASATIPATQWRFYSVAYLWFRIYHADL